MRSTPSAPDESCKGHRQPHGLRRVQSASRRAQPRSMSARDREYRTSAIRPSEWYGGRVLMSQPHHALLFIMTALRWQCLLQTTLLAALAAAESCLKVTALELMDRASTIRLYDHYGHVSAAVCYQNALHHTRARRHGRRTARPCSHPCAMSPGGGKVMGRTRSEGARPVCRRGYVL